MVDDNALTVMDSSVDKRKLGQVLGSCWAVAGQSVVDAGHVHM